MFDFVGKKRWFFLGSTIIILVGLISIFLPQGFKLGTDFKEGSSFILRFSPPISKAQLVQALAGAGYAETEVTIQETKGADYVDFTIITRLLSSNDLYGLWGSSSSDVFAVGNGGTILHYDGNAWGSMSSGTTNDLYGLWGSSSSDVFAVRNGGTILHYDGSAWSSMTSAATDEEESLKNYLKQQLGDYEIIGSGRVSAIVAAETVRNAIIAVAVAALGILLYLAWAFRKMPKPFRYGTCAIISLVHDVLVVLAVFSLLGRVLNLEINAMFITACLAVLGYSVNDTVVVFDRIRENISKGISAEFAATVNRSLTETLTRSLNTTLTTLLACLAVYLFVGGPITGFMLALLVGFASGAYSSFLASQLLVTWERGEWFKFLPKIPLLQRSRG